CRDHASLVFKRDVQVDKIARLEKARDRIDTLNRHRDGPPPEGYLPGEGLTLRHESVHRQNRIARTQGATQHLTCQASVVCRCQALARDQRFRKIAHSQVVIPEACSNRQVVSSNNTLHHGHPRLRLQLEYPALYVLASSPRR